jgi:hypothetical protein
MGHTMSIHSQNDAVILEFGLHKPAYRICVNTPTTHGSIGLTTGLDPAMTLGCGGFGGNITSDNISPNTCSSTKSLRRNTPAVVSQPAPGRRRPPTPRGAGGPAGAWPRTGERIDDFLAARGRPAPGAKPAPPPSRRPASVHRRHRKPAEFVCRKTCVGSGWRKITSGATSSPAARDLGGQRVFIQAGARNCPFAGAVSQD